MHTDTTAYVSVGPGVGESPIAPEKMFGVDQILALKQAICNLRDHKNWFINLEFNDASFKAGNFDREIEILDALSFETIEKLGITLPFLAGKPFDELCLLFKKFQSLKTLSLWFPYNYNYLLMSNIFDALPKNLKSLKVSGYERAAEGLLPFEEIKDEESWQAYQNDLRDKLRKEILKKLPNLESLILYG